MPILAKVKLLFVDKESLTPLTRAPQPQDVMMMMILVWVIYAMASGHFYEPRHTQRFLSSLVSPPLPNYLFVGQIAAFPCHWHFFRLFRCLSYRSSVHQSPSYLTQSVTGASTNLLSNVLPYSHHPPKLSRCSVRAHPSIIIPLMSNVCLAAQKARIESQSNQWRGHLYSLAVITFKSLAAPFFFILSHFGKALLNGQVPFFC